MSAQLERIVDHRVLKHPQTGHIVYVKTGFNWYAFLFGPFWYIFNDLVFQGLAWFAVSAAATSLFSIVGLVLVWTIAGFTAYDAKYKQLLKKGYVDITAELLECWHTESDQSQAN